MQKQRTNFNTNSKELYCIMELLILDITSHTSKKMKTCGLNLMIKESDNTIQETFKLIALEGKIGEDNLKVLIFLFMKK